MPVQYLPDWNPGAGFKHTARVWRQTLYNVVEGPYRFVMEQLVWLKPFTYPTWSNLDKRTTGYRDGCAFDAFGPFAG